MSGPRAEPDTHLTSSALGFSAHRNQLLLTRVMWGSGLATALVPFGLIIALRAPNVALGQVLWARAAVTLAFGIVFCTARWGPARAAVALSFALTLVGTLGSLVLSREMGHPNVAQFVRAVLIILCCGLLFPWRWWEMAVGCGVIVASFVVPALSLAQRPPELTQYLYLLGCTGIIATIGSHLSFDLRRKEFEVRKALEQRTSELAGKSELLSASLERLQNLDKLKTDFFADASHELRTPLSLITLTLRLLRTQHSTSLASNAGAHLAIAERNAQVLLHHINNLLDLARLEAGARELKPRPVPLAPLLSGVVKELSLLAESRGVVLTLDPLAVADAWADPEKLESIFRNLIFNAIKFTPEGGRVSVRLSTSEGKVAVAVADTGQGIAPEQRAALFERYVRSERARGGGTGLGLSIVKDLVDRSEGSISVESDVGVGSTFRVELPAAPAGATAPAPVEPALPAPAELRLSRPPSSAPLTEADDTVLVIEDHVELRELVAEALGAHFRVLCAGTASAGLQLAREKLPSVVLCDLMLPDRSGIDVIRELRATQQTAQLPVILLTANSALEVRVEGLESGAVDFLAKPFSVEELLSRVRVQLRMRRLVTQVAQAQKASMLQTLANGLAHEIRNPMSGVLNSVALIRRTLDATELPLPSRARVLELLDVVDECARGASKLTNDLLALSEAGSVRGEWDPVAGLEAVVGLLAPRLGGIEIHRELAFQGRAAGDAGQLNQVMLNLLDNAIRAAPRGHIWISMRQEANQLKLEVRDDGPGVAQELRERIFDPFFTTAEREGRNGLGLHIARMIVEAHRGTLGVATPAGGGASFVVSIPLGS
ncbi:MAG: response regulator [Deltaproteobacteria bacterium]|nr:response regulator [Deltaproteobacteria bacterium]